MYEIFEHTADLGFHVRARDLASLFAEAGRALFSVVVENLADVRRSESVDIRLQADQTDFLLLDWLTELLYVFETRRLLFSEFSVDIQGNQLAATVHGEPLDTARHRLEHEVKAVTYHGLSVRQQNEAWEARVILDI